MDALPLLTVMPILERIICRAVDYVYMFKTKVAFLEGRLLKLFRLLWLAG